MSSRTDVAEAKEATGRRIARRVWGPMKKQVSDTIGAPAAVASVLLQPMYIPCELVHKVHALVPAEVLPARAVEQMTRTKTVTGSPIGEK